MYDWIMDYCEKCTVTKTVTPLQPHLKTPKFDVG